LGAYRENRAALLCPEVFLGHSLFQLPGGNATVKSMSIRAAVRYLEQGDWEKAHAIAQADKSELGAWAHAIVHLQEGDVDNARHWFGQARRPFSQDMNAELRALALASDES
jgi:Tfp pilus assembly protein PilF